MFTDLCILVISPILPIHQDDAILNNNILSNSKQGTHLGTHETHQDNSRMWIWNHKWQELFKNVSFWSPLIDIVIQQNLE